jgi:hypothetical protein
MLEQMPFASEYGDLNKYPNSSDKLPTSDKMNPQWFLKRIKWGYSSYLNNYFSFPYSDRLVMMENRAYGQGAQDITRYMDQLCPIKKNKLGQQELIGTFNGQPQFKRKGWYNINWNILSVAPKFRDRVIGNFMKMDYNIGAYAVDEMSDDERKQLMYKLWAEAQEQEFLDFMDATTGTSPDEKTAAVPFMPKSQEELEMLSNMGCFKLGTEIAMEEVCDLSFFNSRWPIEIKKQIFEDFYDCGRACVKDYVDPVTQQILTRYVDPVNLLIRETRSNTYNEIDFVAEAVPTTIANIRAMASWIPEEELQNMANRFQGIFGNPILSYGGYNSYSLMPQTSYDNFTVWILDGEFKTFDYAKYKIKDYGDYQIAYDKELTYKGQSEPGKEVVESAMEQWYRFKWVIGTDQIYDWGYQHNIPRPSINEARSSFHMFRAAGVPIGGRTKTIIDQIQLNYLRLQNDIVKSPPAGIAIEASSITNITLGGQLQDPRDILAIYHSNGDLIYKINDRNQQLINGGRKPVESLPGGMGPILNERIAVFNFNLNMLREITGLGVGADASQPPAEQGLGTTQIALQATNDVLNPLLVGYRYLKEETAKNFCYRAQVLAHFGKIKGYLPGIGNNVGKFIEIGKEITMARMGIKIEALVDETEKQLVLNAASQSLAAAKTGQVGITLSDYFFILRNINHGNLKMCQVYLAHREEQIRQQQLSAAAQNQQLNDQNAQAMEMMKGQNAQAVIQGESQKEMALENAKTQGALLLQREKDAGAAKLEYDKHVYTMQQIRAKAEADAAKDIKVAKNTPQPVKAAS